MVRSCAAERRGQHCKVCSKYSNRRIPPQRNTQAEVDGQIKRRHEEKQHTPRVGIRQRELVQHDEKRQPYPGNEGKVRKVRKHDAVINRANYANDVNTFQFRAYLGTGGRT